MVHWAHVILPSQTGSRLVQPFFCTAQPCDQHADTQSHRQTTLRAIPVKIGRIYAVHVMRPNNNNNK